MSLPVSAVVSANEPTCRAMRIREILSVGVYPAIETFLMKNWIETSSLHTCPVNLLHFTWACAQQDQNLMNGPQNATYCQSDSMRRATKVAHIGVQLTQRCDRQ